MLRDAGADATILAYRRIYPSFARAGRQGRHRADGWKTSHQPPSSCPGSRGHGFRARQVLRSRSPQIVVVQWWHPITSLSTWYLARLARKRLHARVIFVCHNASPHEGFPLARALTRLALGSGDLLIALSEGVAGELRSLLAGRGRVGRSTLPTPCWTRTRRSRIREMECTGRCRAPTRRSCSFSETSGPTRAFAT